jgi:hypothetical protein
MTAVAARRIVRRIGHDGWLLVKDVNARLVGKRLMLVTLFLGGLSRRSTYQKRGEGVNPARGQRKGGRGENQRERSHARV